jgi:hypothetical protein
MRGCRRPVPEELLPHRPARSGRHRPGHRANPSAATNDPPGELIDIDVEKLGGIPDSGGHKVLGRAVGRAHQDRRNGTGYACLHTALDDHSGPAYTEHLPDEKAVTCAAFLRRAVA